MKTYEIKLIHDLKYRVVIFSNCHLNPLDDICEIEEELKSLNCREDIILVDLLLCNGNASNRFIKLQYDGEKIDTKKIEVLKISRNESIREMCCKFYKDNEKYLDNSILHNSHKFLIKHGEVI